MTTDKMIEEQALHIISQLNPDEKELYILYYLKHKKLKDIAIELNVKYDTIRKRHEKLKKKLNSKIKNVNNFLKKIVHIFPKTDTIHMRGYFLK